ncbi:ABC transporter substrate-binding protein [Pseudoflavonifractor phocaeensis]|uniref:ABC transporter substrate-binding protein n=1 Tax=Pseudoflavonifractor phocaeensis TaxID=1870988 RepID=UPI001F470BBC|nr:ABC transporter substrate-binding protein [Pseudoflavonifractor phocaeensis]
MKKKLSRALAMLLSVSMLAAMLAGCGGKTSSSSGTASAGASSAAGSSAGASADVLKLAVTTGDGQSTDDKIPTPWYNRTFAANLMFRSLFVADSTLTKTSPDLAESCTISDDGLTYTITLKDGLKWSDGEALTVDDVVWSIETAKKAAQVNPNYSTAFSYISSLSAEGNVITMVLTSPYSAMMDVLAQFAILPKHCLEKADPLSIESDPYWAKPVCSGMYCVDELNVGNYFTMKVNEHYEGAAPKIQKIQVSFVSDYVTAAQSGIADYVYGNDANLVNTLNGMDNYTGYQIDQLFYKYFIFNMKGVDGKENPAMQNVLVRKALMEAIDRAALANLYPSASVLNGGVPNTDEAYNGFEWKYDLDQAKADLAASGYDMNRTLRICYYNNDQTSVDLINTVVYYLEQLGLKVEATLSNDGTTDLFTTRDYDIGFKGKSAFAMNEWYTEYLSTDGLFSNIYGGDASFDALVADLMAATDSASRKAALTALQNLEQELVYKVPMFIVGTYVFVSDHVKLPDGVSFCNPFYSCDLDFANWELA